MNVTRRSILGLVISAGMMAATAAAHAESVLMIKGGSYTLDDERQAIVLNNGFGATTVVNAAFDEDATGVFGLAYEWRFRDGFAVGPELFHFQNDWSGVLTTARGDVDNYVINVVGRKYFAPTPWLHPYLGVGAGFAIADLSGSISGSGFGFAAQGVAGIELKAGSAGFFVEVKKLIGNVEDSEDGDVDIGGTAVLGGLAIHF